MNNFFKMQTPKRVEKLIVGVRMMSPRFSSLDEQRCLSMADEGGASAAYIEGSLNDRLSPLRKFPEVTREAWDTLASRVLASRVLASRVLERRSLAVIGGLMSVGLSVYLGRNMLRRANS